MKTKMFFCIIIMLGFFTAAGISAQELYKTTAKEMGFSSLDYTVTEIKRTDQTSTIRIPGFHQRSAAASRWMMCVYTDLAQKRGFEYWAVVYPAVQHEDVMVGFPRSENEDIAKTLGPEFVGKMALSVMPVRKMTEFCRQMQQR